MGGPIRERRIGFASVLGLIGFSAADGRTGWLLVEVIKGQGYSPIDAT